MEENYSSRYSEKKPPSVSLYTGSVKEDLAIKAKLLEMEIEKQQQQKALEYIKQVREYEKKELVSGLEKVREEAKKTEEQVRAQMA